MTTNQKKNKPHILLIICHNEKERAAELILQNGYANSIEKARKLVHEVNGK